MEPPVVEALVRRGSQYSTSSIVSTFYGVYFGLRLDVAVVCVYGAVWGLLSLQPPESLPMRVFLAL